MRHQYRKPDPLVLLAVFVGLGVVVTTGTLAVGSDPASTVAAAPSVVESTLPPTGGR